MGMKLDVKAATGIAVALVGLGTAGGLALQNHGDSKPTPARQVQQVADTSAGSTASPGATRSHLTVLQPAGAAAVTVDPTTTAPEPAPTPTVEPSPTAQQTVIDVGPGTVDSSGAIQPPSLPPNLNVLPRPTQQVPMLPSPTGSR